MQGYKLLSSTGKNKQLNINQEKPKEMTLAKIYLLGQEREVLWTHMGYHREIGLNGRPSSIVMGGHITVSFTSQASDDIILYSMTKDSQEPTEKDKMFEGKLCFYEDGFDYPPTKTYFYNDAFLIYFQESFSASNGMQTTITISPAIQDYGAPVEKSWNQKQGSKNEDAPSSPSSPLEEHDPQILECYYTDLEGNKTAEPLTGDEVYLVLKTQSMIGETIDIELSNHAQDFLYNDELLPDDLIKAFQVTSDLHKIKLKVALPQKEPVQPTKA